MTSKEKIIGLAQRAQVAAQAAGYTVDLRLYNDRLRLSLCNDNFVCLSEVCLAYGIDNVLGCAILEALSGSCQPQYRVGANQEGGEQ